MLRHVHAASSGEWSPLFVFHVDRNRLLMVTKDATAAAGRCASSRRYPLTTASMALRTVRQALADRQPPGGPADPAAAAGDRLLPAAAAADAGPPPAGRPDRRGRPPSSSGAG